MPIAFGADDRSNHGAHNLAVFGRLKAGTSVQQASNDLKQIARQLETAYPDSNQGWSVLLTPVRQAFIGDIQTAILLLWGAVAFVLLIACSNIANLLLARSVSRQSDVAIQLALGATRFRISRELLKESIVLALIGGVAGLVVAVWGESLKEGGRGGSHGRARQRIRNALVIAELSLSLDPVDRSRTRDPQLYEAH